MIYCAKCGVSLNPSVSQCPVCAYPVPLDLRQSEEKDNQNDLPNRSNIRPLTHKEMRGIAFEILSIILFLIVGVLLITNLVINGSLSWSRIPVVSVFAFWVCSFFILRLFKYPSTILWGITFSIHIFLIVLYLLRSTGDWYLLLAFPLVNYYALLSWFLLMVYRKYQYLTAWYWILLMGGLSVSTILAEFCIKLYQLNLSMKDSSLLATLSLALSQGKWQWSWIVLLSTSPLLLLLLYYQLSLRNKIDLRRIFHL